MMRLTPAINTQLPDAVLSSGKKRSQHASFLPFYFTRKAVLVSAIFLGASFLAKAQTDAAQADAAYRKTLEERSAKIVTTLNLADSVKYRAVQNELVNQYIAVNAIHADAKAAIGEIKKQSSDDSARAQAIRAQENKKSSKLLQQHEQFIGHLKKELNEQQLDKVKDGMTYSVFPITYKAFLEMIPSLTEVQKNKIYNWLKEARELAMDEGSSDDKHKVFGKYKGRINNYLSAEGYDLKKEREQWQERTKKDQSEKKG